VPVETRISRIILGIEATILVLPLSLLFLWMVLPNILDLGSGLDYITCAIVFAGITSAWRLIFAFTTAGGGGLLALSTFWWLISAINALLVLVTFFSVTLSIEIPGLVGIFWWGSPLLVPFAHLIFEYYRFKKPSNCD